MTGVQTCALRSEEHTSELQSHDNLVCRLLLEKKTERHRGRGPHDTSQRRPAPPRTAAPSTKPRGPRPGGGSTPCPSAAWSSSSIFFLRTPPPTEFSPFPHPPPTAP